MSIIEEAVRLLETAGCKYVGRQQFDAVISVATLQRVVEGLIDRILKLTEQNARLNRELNDAITAAATSQRELAIVRNQHGA